MKNTNEITDLLDNPVFKEWAQSSFDATHTFTTSSLYSSFDSQTLERAKVLYSTLGHTTMNLNLAKRSSILKNIHKTIEAEKVTIETTTQPSVSKSMSYKWMGIAASLVALIAFMFVLNTNQPLDMQTGYGEIATVNLPDGSIVHVDANSSLKMTDTWSNNGDRNLILENSALFDVTNVPKVGGISFNVLTENAIVEVIGTQFWVDTDGDNFSVTVKSGQVRVKPTENADFETQILTAGDQLIYENGQLVATNKLSNKQLDNELAWTEGQMVFENTSLVELEKMVKDRFNHTLIINEALRSSSRSLDGRLPITTVKDLLDGVSATLDLETTYKDETILMGYPKKN